MELSKKNILSLIEKNKKKDFKIINLNIFGNEILLDIETNNPTYNQKKILKIQLKKLFQKISLKKLNLRLISRLKKPNHLKIKLKEIQ